MIPPRHSAGQAGPAASPSAMFTWMMRLLIVIIVALYAPRLIALFPLGHDISLDSTIDDDWLHYHRNALSVLHQGLSMPAVQEPYYRPAGFGYTYFVALAYAVGGERSGFVYLVQALLLLASIAGVFIAARRSLSEAAAAILLLVVAGVLYVDVYRSLTFRLLAENLLIPLTVLLLLMVRQLVARPGRAIAAAIGVLCGLCFLVRPNTALYAPVLALLITGYLPGPPLRSRIGFAAVLLVAFAAVASLVSVRNYVVTGQAQSTLVSSTADWYLPGLKVRDRPTAMQRATRFATGYGRRMAFAVGIPQYLAPNFRVRPHWLLLWAGVVLHVLQLRRRTIEFWEAAVLGLAVAYFGPVIAIGTLSSYGTRMLAPGMVFLAILAVKALDVRAGRSRSTLR
ncbi:MAG TPA: glycosyltransferase family 39 protein [Vicinamibacterales bacterium]|nr:glycosyltransferase family 39 protein [Vicinamibacterales bacterium]